MNGNVSQFKTVALSPEVLRLKVPSAFAPAPMTGLSSRYTFVSTASIVDALQERDWIPVYAEEQRVRTAARLGFQKHVIRFRLARQITTLDEWNVELVRGQWGQSSIIDKWAWRHTVDAWRDRSAFMALTDGIMS